MINADYTVINILDMIKVIGEDETQNILSDFSCEYKENKRNDSIEHFLQTNAIDFANKKMSITYFVLNTNVDVVGIFTLTHKPIIIKSEILSKTGTKRIEKHAHYNHDINAYNLSAFLIAQFSKNYALALTGKLLMEHVLATIQDIQQQIGGGIVFLECEKVDDNNQTLSKEEKDEKKKLQNFYKMDCHKFTEFGECYSNKDKTLYAQMFKFL